MRSEFKTKQLTVTSSSGESAILLYDTIIDYVDTIGGTVETERARSNPRLANDQRSVKPIGNRQYEIKFLGGTIEIFTETH